MTPPFQPRKLIGPWDSGYALDLHSTSSTFLGHNEFGHPMYETTRTAIGELLYRLKYSQDREAIDALVEATVKLLGQWKPRVDAIVVVPPSNTRRKTQPVLEVAKGVSKRLDVPLLSKALTKIKDTPELKSVYDFAERAVLLDSAFETDPKALGGKAVLLIDDLYRSGATLSEITKALKQGGVTTVFVLCLTKTRRNA